MQNDKLKKIIPIIIILILLGLGFLAYFLFFKTPNEAGRPNLPISNNNNIPSGNNSENQGSNTNEGGNTGAFKPVLRLVYETPVSGGVTYNKNGKNYTRFIERGKGNVYETEAENIRPQRLTNNTIPQIYNAFWTKNGENVIGQYLRDQKDVQTFVGSIKSRSVNEGELQTQFVGQNIGQINLSPNDNRLIYITTGDIGSKIIRSNLSLGEKVEIFNSPLNDWLVDYPNNEIVSITSKPSSKIDGLTQTINTRTGIENAVITGIKGLTTLLNSTSEKMLFSESKNNEFETYVLDLSNERRNIFQFKTLPEKCVWSYKNKNVVFCAVPEEIQSGEYPEDWYLGKKSFRDEIWQSNIETGETVYLSNLNTDSGEEIDAYKISISQDEKFITFINKNNLKLYTLQIAK